MDHDESINSFVINQKFDTDSIVDDFEDILFCDKNQSIDQYKSKSNFYELFNGDKEDSARSFLKMIVFMETHQSYICIQS